MAVAGSSCGVAAIALPARTADAALDRLCEKAHIAPSCMRETPETSFGTLPERLAAFIRGEKVGFPDSIDRRRWTDFRSRVWEATRLIPYGQTRSYAWVAAAAGQPGAYRATGQALHHNPVPIVVPCHRVIGAGGALTGFGGGLELKGMLLALEVAPPAGSAELE